MIRITLTLSLVVALGTAWADPPGSAEPADAPAMVKAAVKQAEVASVAWPVEGTLDCMVPRRVVAIDIPKVMAERPIAQGLGKLFMAQLMITDDDGANWKSCGLYKDVDRPLLVKLPDDGRYGFRLVGYDQAGNRAGWPEAGDRPTIRVGVDSLAPLTEFTMPVGVRYFRGGQTYDISYKTEDANLAENPVRFELTVDGGTTWKPVLENAKPQGTFTWTAPADIDSRNCALRIVSVDTAGNTTVKQTDHLFTIDSTAPKVRILGPELTMSKRVLVKREINDGTGSGVARLDLYASSDGGANWTQAGSYRGDEAVIYKAEPGKVLLHLVAVDHAGNASPAPGKGTAGHPLVVGDDKPVIMLEIDKLTRTMAAGEQLAIRWRGAGHNLDPKPVVVQYTLDGGINWVNLLTAAASTGSYTWTLPQVTSSRCAIRVALVDRQGRITIERTPEPFAIDASRPVTRITVEPTENKLTEPRYAANTAAEAMPVSVAANPATGIEPAPVSGADPVAFADDIVTRAGATAVDGPPSELTVDQTIDRGIRYSREGKFIMARQYLQQAVDTDPTRARAWYELGKVYANSVLQDNHVGRAEANNAAVLHFEKALELDPKMAAARNDLGLVYLRTGKLDKALEAFRGAYELDETTAVYPFNVGLAYFQQDKLDEARQFFERAVRLDPGNGHALWYMARTLQESQQIEDAKIYWKRAAMAFGTRSRFGRMALQHLDQLEKRPTGS